MATKICSRCREEKDISLFGIRNNRKSGHTSRCRECLSIVRKEYYSKNPTKAIEYSREYHNQHKEERKGYQQNYYLIQKQAGIEKNYNVEKKKQYQTDNRKHISRIQAKRRNSDPRYRIQSAFSTRIREVLRGSKMGKHWEDLVGYTTEQLILHIEQQFDSFMNWGNYGEYWHIDHIVPVSHFNFTSEEDIEFQKCWSLNNLQPLEAGENRRKHNKLLYNTL